MAQLAAILLTALTTSACAAGRELPNSLAVVIYDNTTVDLAVEVASHRFITIAPGTSAAVDLQRMQWIEFGIMAHEYRLPPEVFVAPGRAGVRLQAENNGKLYLVPADAKSPVAPLPPQPAGFPIEPVSIVDLT